MSRLDDVIRSVPADPSAADDSQEVTDQDLDVETPDSQGDSEDSDNQPDSDKPGRSVENVRGELLRKLEKSNEMMMQELQALRDESKKLAEQYGTPVSQPANPNRTLDQMSVKELEGMRGQVPEEQLPAFDAYLQERRIDAKVEERLQKFQTTAQLKSAEQKFNEQAVSRWPQLRDRTSDFYRVADRILGEMGDAASNNPRAVLDAANEAGLELGMSPATGIKQQVRREGNKVAPGRKNAPGPGGSDSADYQQMDNIASKLANAMPNKKFTKEQLKRIAERDKQYKQNIHTFIRG